jgi:Flp pilus assembly protein protease CpaA
MLTIVLIVCLAALLFGTVTDLRSREVPDWLNYGLMSAGFGFAIIYSIAGSDWTYIIESIIGFALMFAVGCGMYYSGQWGGGDAKMVMGLGALIGLPLPWHWFSDLYGNGLPFLLNFAIYTILAGAVYGLIWSLVLSFMHRKAFWAKFSQLTKEASRTKLIMVIAGTAFAALSFFMPFEIKILLLITALLLMCSTYLFVFVKTVEAVCMLKHIPIDKLTEGDWIAEDVQIGKKTVYVMNKQGIEKKDIEMLLGYMKNGKLKSVLVKEGIPFVPSFLMAFVIAYFLGSGLFIF